MKHLNPISILAFFVLLFASCSESGTDDLINPKYRDVRLAVNEGFISQEFEPMSRADSKVRYYGMNVYKDGQPYAYGVFDDQSKMNIRLEVDGEYSFECTALEDDRRTIAKIHDKAAGDVFKFPFCVGTEENDDEKGYPLSELNHFVFSEKENLYSICAGKSTVATQVAADGFATKYKNETFPSQYRWYGVLDDCDISSGEIEIELKFVSFGVKVHSEEVPEGSVTWSCSSCDFGNPILDDDNLEVTNVFSFHDFKLAQSYFIRLNIVWTHSSGKSNGPKSVDIEVKPNTMFDLKLNLQE